MDEVDKIVGRFAHTRRAAAQIAASDPDNPAVQGAVGTAYSITGAHDQALAAFKRLAFLAPQNGEAHYNLAIAQQNVGDLVGAANSYRRAIALAPDLVRAYYGLVQLEKQSVASNWIPPLLRLFALPDPTGVTALHAGHALAKSYEDMGDLEQSFAWLVQAKRLRGSQRRYDRRNDGLVAEAAMAARGQGPGHDSREPIFIMGLPRTGTSLVDRILSSHPDVGSAGELSNFPQLMKAMAATPGPLALDPATLRAAQGLDMARLGRAYVESTRPITGDHARFIDKAPINYLVAGLIVSALPNARVICLVRDPMDACLSLFRQMFATEHPYYDYHYDLANTARAYANFLRVAAHWRETLPPDRYLEVRYESVIDDLDGQARRMLDFCDLTWDERVLAFHENKSAISTPSLAQVRRPVYRSAIGRWRAYGALVDPLREALAAEGVGETLDRR